MNYPSIRIEGAIFSPDLLDRLEDLPGQRPADFGLDGGVRVKDEIARAWADAQDYWRIFQRRLAGLRPDASAATETRQQWIVPLLGLLGYQLDYQPRGVEIDDKIYPISHRIANRGHTPIHIIGAQDPAGLDRKPERAQRRMSAHGMVQEYLNLQDELYGLVTNGRLLRLLRDSSRLVKLTYLEFDLERIFQDNLFADFAVLYRLLHVSRLPSAAESAAESLLERYHQDSLDSGARIRDGLSRAVEEAIRDFANGFLAHPANEDLRNAATSGRLRAADYYQMLLRLIYRLLFLLVIEERDLIFPAHSAGRGRKIYEAYYSLQRLRRLSEKRHLAEARRHDLWLALLATFRLFEEGGPGRKMEVAPLAGDLFDANAIGLLNRCMLGNDVLLKCLQALGIYRHPDTGQRIRVNYAALNVEEFGSVYEGLLEYAGAFVGEGHRLHFTFTQGTARAATGSHYTADDLVQPLLKHSLDYLIAERLEQAREIASREVGGGEVGNRGRERERERGRERRGYGGEFVSGSGSVAEGDAVGGTLLSGDASVPEGRDVWSDVADPASGDVDPRQYRGGLGTRGDAGVHSLSEGGAGQSQGIGDPLDPQSTGRHDIRKDRQSRSGSMRRSGTDDPLPDWFFAAEAEWGNREVGRQIGNREVGSGEVGKRGRTLGVPLPLSPYSLSPYSLPPYSLLAEHALLSLRVADISCGSGHILLAAARRIAAALATVRTGEEQPSPAAFRAALRDVIRTCIYGVDLNPLAVELCKVALWLEAHVPGEPLNFLDHHIKCGNAIVGFVTPEDVGRGVPDEAFSAQLAGNTGGHKATATLLRQRNKEERKQQGQLSLQPSADTQQRIERVLHNWRQIAAMPEQTPTQIRDKKARFEEFSEGGDAFYLSQIAAIPIAQFYLPKTADQRDLHITDGEFREYWTGARRPQGQASAAAWGVARNKRFFHWFLEFPEIVARGGFDCILGNPPYLGGQALSGTYGYPFCEYVKWEYAPTGLSELVVFFVRRIFKLLRPGGLTSFITTNSIKDGDVRKDGLEQVLVQGGSINFAMRGIKWPGRANLVVSLVAVYKGEWHGQRLLDGQSVSSITAYLDDTLDLGEPKALEANRDRLYQGSIFLGEGFLLPDEEAENMVRTDARNQEVIFDTINGGELNNFPDQLPRRKIINFSDWPFERG
jgi:hypothetical protein